MRSTLSTFFLRRHALQNLVNEQQAVTAEIEGLQELALAQLEQTQLEQNKFEGIFLTPRTLMIGILRKKISFNIL